MNKYKESENIPSFVEQDKKLKQFESFVVGHTIIEQVKEQLISCILNPAGTFIFLVLGPSGVGKTTLAQVLEEYFIEQMKEELVRDRGRIPIVRTEVVGFDSGKFTWKDYYYRTLEALQEPLINHKVIIENQTDNVQNSKINYHSRSTWYALRGSLENAFKFRRPVACIVDEAQHLLKVSGSKSLQNQLDTIKSLANQTKVPHILVGTYELKEFFNLSAQLSRRTISIHFPRYKASNVDEYRTFLSVIHMLQKNMPLEEEPNLLQHADFIYERTLGCIGILKDWLTRCLGDALHNQKSTITKEILYKYAMPIQALEMLYGEIEQGEALFAENEQHRMNFLYKIGLKEREEKQAEKTVATRGRKVGMRNPKRDPVGKQDYMEG
ncbi:AAA family ATPase [Bacillus cereus group sp. BfR-BA-01523]|uniref:AAA family ATPase n=1 Tax=Bacillus cereus group sp. BfR-BA-01523 TaxID=2920371 RepID=UPI001F585FF2|nr:ATP-binding protein [Bacillus cereus group sp. BfR-BA-01523]